MKKILTLVFAMLMIASLGVSAMAQTFVSSPSGKEAPELVSFKTESEECTSVIKICSYSDRAELGEAGKAKIEEAYASIAGCDDLGKLNSELDALADEVGIASEVFAVSDLFDVYYVGCDDHEEHGAFSIEIKPATIENFAAVMHYTDDGWDVVVAEPSEEGTLTFTVEELSPFAIVVHDGSVVVPDGFDPFALGAGGFTILAALLFIVVLSRKLLQQ
ncbi:MAG: hypothetical protein IKC32_01545 [Clostridia bacterium]|nr:hypothetical protein [Clostridia bacterium]